MDIPLPRMLRQWRRLGSERQGAGPMIRAWAYAARRPWLYRLLAVPAVAVLSALGRKKGRFRRLPLAAGWTGPRDLPAPEGGTFLGLWKSRRDE